MDPVILSETEHRAVVGSRLRRIIEMLDMTYVEAATLMNTSKQTLNGWMKGEGYPNWYSVYRLQRTKGVTFDFLFAGDWSGLPAKLAAAMDAELRREMDAALARDRAGA